MTPVPALVATSIARHAVLEPFRQTPAMRTEPFARWLQERGVDLSEDWLRFMARTGILRPVAWTQVPETEIGQRFIAVGTDDEVLFADCGRVVSRDDLPVAARDLTEGDACWWHPFQLWQAQRITGVLSVPFRPTTALDGPDAFAQLLAIRFERMDPRDLMLEVLTSAEWLESSRVLALLLAVEPLVIELLTNKIRLDSFDETLDDLLRWRSSFEHTGVLSEIGVDLDIARRWHYRLAQDAELRDPLGKWRELIRYASRSRRLALKGAALCAEDGYYAAEVIRRYLQNHHDVNDIPDEDLVRLGSQVPKYKQELYGRETTTDGDRSVFRNVVRQYELDPQPRLRWFVEGRSEIGFLTRWAELELMDLDRMGVELVNMGGIGAIDSDRVRSLLELSRDEEVFTKVTVDADNKEPARRLTLQKLSEAKLVTAEFTLFQPDFEGGNFTPELLFGAANSLCVEAGLGRLPDELIESTFIPGKPPIESLRAVFWRERRFTVQKNEAWGRALADLLRTSHSYSTTPIVKNFEHSLRAATSNYRFSVS